ncbi:hypothetical protein AXF42_Ash004811 [Apostasia shenzhenica]|uniref:DUF4408 domain-containing protein n=1 Tax=Apostasia shenzhenica TaxID=1088818 RepID=A0A2I0B7N3_9ASPA|nr:hypothetical protein AXF42_Ash004811 [Apostasia shenzhenica]
MKKYKNQLQQLLPKTVQLLLSLFFLCFFLSSPLWFPSSSSILKKAKSVLLGHKFLFIVCNVIVIFLLRDSKLSKPSLLPDSGEEYISRNRGFQNRQHSVIKDKEFHSEMNNRGEEQEDDEEEEDVEEMEELKKKVEDFIARVNKQHNLEAKTDRLLWLSEEWREIS